MSQCQGIHNIKECRSCEGDALLLMLKTPDTAEAIVVLHFNVSEYVPPVKPIAEYPGAMYRWWDDKATP